MKKLLIYTCLLFLCLSTTSSFAEVRLPKVLSSHMVLQQNSVVKIWGWADPGEQVTVKTDWSDATVSDQADANGQWQVSIKTLSAGKPHQLTITGQNEIKLEDILFGEVWLASGQSNMEMPLIHVSGAYTAINNSAEEVANANYPEIRLFQAGNFSSKEPLDDAEAGIEMYGVPTAKCQWQACQPETVPTFAATAYFFARELHTRLKVPVGIIDASWGGTSAEAWTPKSGLEKLGYTKELEQAVNAPQISKHKVPTRLYNGMIHPLRNVKIKGAIWYQGEGNSSRANKYKELFSTMITEWRTSFGYEFPFYFVQISPFGYKNVNAAFLREAQLDTLSLAQTGMAVTMDHGHLTDIHPKNKQVVGLRLALWALAKNYNQPIVYSGPIYKSSTIAGNTVRLAFEHANGGLATSDGNAPSHFEIAGEDQVFHPATAVIKGEELIVSSPKVAQPKAVRYAFTSAAMPNLINKTGLPASSFRTDRW